MIYIDEELCTGCGVCLAACTRAALSLNGNAAVIDESLCTSCGRCVDTCLTGAIISMEVIPQPLPLALAQTPEAQPFWAGAPSLPAKVTGAVTSPGRQPVAASKLDLLEKGLNVLNSLFAHGGHVLDRKHGPGTRTGGGQGCGDGQVIRVDHGLGGGRGLGGPAGCGGRKRMNRRNRAT